MGRVLHENSGCVLKAGDLEYKLDDVDAVSVYNRKNVKIMGSLDRPSNTIHVEKDRALEVGLLLCHTVLALNEFITELLHRYRHVLVHYQPLATLLLP